MDFLVAILPIGCLIYVMTKKQAWPSHISLPFAATLVYLLVLVHSHLDPSPVNATVVNGALAALTPISCSALFGVPAPSDRSPERLVPELFRSTPSDVCPQPHVRLAEPRGCHSARMTRFTIFSKLRWLSCTN